MAYIYIESPKPKALKPKPQISSPRPRPPGTWPGVSGVGKLTPHKLPRYKVWGFRGMDCLGFRI